MLSAIFLNTFYHRSCFEFVAELFPTATCQTTLDWALIFLAAIGAGMAVNDERVGILGFLVAHSVASVLFVIGVMLPVLLGLTDPGLGGSILSQTVVLALLSSVPFGVFFSLVGSVLGLYLGSKLDRQRGT